ncbi:MAG: hypothetical protein GY762_20790, partial [Proteobacteria bacterium]|nr:hypothetical protein [Pseudomonadota bacterium]
LRAIHDDRVRLDADLASDLDRLHREFDPSRIELQPQEIPPRKSDLKVGYVMIVWIPWQIAADGESMPLTEVSEGPS